MGADVREVDERHSVIVSVLFRALAGNDLCLCAAVGGGGEKVRGGHYSRWCIRPLRF